MGAGSDLTGTRHVNTGVRSAYKQIFVRAQRQHNCSSCGRAVAAAVLRARRQAGRQTPAATGVGCVWWGADSKTQNVNKLILMILIDVYKQR